MILLFDYLTDYGGIGRGMEVLNSAWDTKFDLDSESQGLGIPLSMCKLGFYYHNHREK